jgi:peptide/nickel transport system ATP-binding protein
MIPIIRGVHAEFQLGKVYTIVGNSGSGKSIFAHTLIRVLAQNCVISKGTVRFHHVNDKDGSGPGHTEVLTSYGANSVEMRNIRARHIGMIFQEPAMALSPVHRCGEMISSSIRLRWPDLDKSEVKNRVVETLDSLRVPNAKRVAGQYPFELSGGVCQRVCIALAIVRRPQILIADEPTTALDVTTQKEVLDLLEAMKREYGLTVLLITHDIGVAAQISDEIIVMKGGEFVDRNSTNVLLRHPEHEHAKSLIHSALKLQRRSIIKPRVQPGANESASTVLEIRGLTLKMKSRSGRLFRKSPEEATVLNDIDVDLHGEEILGVVGESGCGKTTLAKCIVGLNSNFRGSIRFRSGSQMMELKDRGRRRDRAICHRIRMVFQNPFSSLNPRRKIVDSVAEPLLVFGMSKAEARSQVSELLGKVGLDEDVMDRFPHAFSGGQRQRICIARAVITRPSILIADEATSALDASLRIQVLDLLLELQAKMKFSVILITHDISTVRYCADRVVVMSSGRIVEHGPVDTVLIQPRDAYTKRLMAAVPQIERA